MRKIRFAFAAALALVAVGIAVAEAGGPAQVLTQIVSFFHLSSGTTGQAIVKQADGSWAPATVSGGGGTPGGDLSGASVAAATVVGIQGRSVTSTAPTLGNSLQWNGSAWVPASVNGNAMVAPPPLYGDGSDGTVVLDGVTTYNAFSTLSGSTYTLTRDVFANGLTVNSGVTVACAGCVIYSGPSLTNSGTIQCDGTSATDNNGATGPALNGGFGAVGPADQSGGSGGANAVGSDGLGNSSTAAGGSGGAGGAGGGHAGGAGGVNAYLAGNGSFRSLVTATGGDVPAGGNAVYFGAGGGGGGAPSGGTGGGGGSGAGPVSVFAQAITNSGSIHANGGSGAVGTGTNAGGGGGGGGGVVWCICSTFSGTSPTAAGGSGGGHTGTGSSGSAGSAGAVVTITGYGGASQNPALNDCRVTLSSTAAITTSDVTGASTLHLLPVPGKGDKISLKDSTGRWIDDTCPNDGSVSLAVSSFVGGGSPNSLFDVFAYDNNGTPALSAPQVWQGSGAGSSTRSSAGALAVDTGNLVLASDHTRRLVATVYLDSNKQINDCAVGGDATATAGVGRCLANFDNAIPTDDFTEDSGAATRTTTSSLWGPITGDAWKHTIVVTGLYGLAVDATASAPMSTSSSIGWAALGIGVNSVSAVTGTTGASPCTTTGANFTEIAQASTAGNVGLQVLNGLFQNSNGDTTTIYNTGTASLLHAGLRTRAWR